MAVRRRWVVVALLVVAAAGGLLWSAPAFAGADQAVTLQFKGKPGDESRYRMQASATIDMKVSDPSSGNVVFTMAPQFTMQMLSLQRIDAVAPNGDLTVGGPLEAFAFSFTLGDLNASLSLAGPDGSAARFPRLPELPLRAVMSPRGALVSLAGLESLPIPQIPLGKSGAKLDLKTALPKIIAMFSIPVLPDHPVRPGDTWQAQLAMDPQAIIEALGIPVPPQAIGQFKAMKTTFTITSTLTGFETVGGVQTAVIRSDTPWQLSIPTGPDSPTITESGRTTVVSNFDYAAGRKVRDQVTSEFQMSAGGGDKEFAHMTMQLKATTDLVP